MSDCRIVCEICGAKVHSVQLHIKNEHKDWSVERYKDAYPDSPLLSDTARQKLAAHQAKVSTEKLVSADSESVSGSDSLSEGTRLFHEVFGLGKAKSAFSSSGDPIPVKMPAPTKFPELVPAIDEDYVFNIENLKDMVIAMEDNIPLYLYGHMGTGKTTGVEQMCARTGRPVIRIQHTADTEESEIVGQWVVVEGEKGPITEFQLGPLPTAMINGWVYLADEYDFVMPQIAAAYQAVMETGKPLVIKSAKGDQRIIQPAEGFRFVATGNSNGSGDETGLYQGVNLQNAANYDRFGIVLEVKYMEPTVEEAVLMKRAGINRKDAKDLVKYATSIREEYAAGKFGLPIGPRGLIFAAKVGVRRGSFLMGLERSFINKLGSVDKKVATDLAQRYFGV